MGRRKTKKSSGTIGSNKERFSSAVKLHQSGRIDEARRIYMKLIADNPHFSDALHLAGVAAHQQRDHEQAIRLINRAISEDPDQAVYHDNLGLVYLACRRFEDARAAFEKAVSIQSDLASAWLNLGNLFQDMGKLDAAIETYESAKSVLPKSADILYNLGLLYEKTGRDAEAVDAYRRVAAALPRFGQNWMGLGRVQHRMGLHEDALAAFRRVLDLSPDNSEALHGMGRVLCSRGKLSDAADLFNKILQKQPDSPEALNSLGTVRKSQGRAGEALTLFEKSIAANPGCAETYYNKGTALLDHGRVQEAVEAFRSASTMGPHVPVFRSGLLMALHYQDRLSREELFSEHTSWQSILGKEAPGEFGHHRHPGPPHRPLRIGYVSPDFKTHSVAYFLKGIMEGHNRDEFQVYCYADVALQDSMTDYFRQKADAWRDIRGVSDRAAAERIYRDRIDILVDLAGHTSGNRLGVFALKPAPVQVTYLGYPDTTGLGTMDYRITDQWADPAGTGETYHTETLLRIPGGFLCYRPPENSPAVEKRKEAGSAGIVFGSFNYLAKISSPVLDLWVEILHAVPGSSMLVKSGPLLDPDARRILESRFAKRGIDKARLELVGYIADPGAHLSLYNRVDISLDTFPYHGTATTCEALWMGTPVIVLAGDTHLSRVGVSLLSRTGLGNLIADRPEEYVEKAVALAGNPRQMEMYHRTLRSTVAQSGLMDARGFVSELEKAYSTMWRQWCDGAGPEKPKEASRSSGKRNKPRESVAPGPDDGIPASEGYRRAVMYLQRGLLEEAEKQSRLTLRENPGHPDVLQLAGLIARQKGETAQAASFFKEAIVQAPQNPFLHDHLGQVYQMQGKFEEAAASFRQALTLKPDAPLMHVHLGNCLQSGGEYPEAIGAYEKALEMDAHNVDALCGLGNALRMTGDLNGAVEILKTAVAHHPETAGVHNNLGLALQAAGKLPEARENFRKAVALAPEDAAMHFNLAEFYSGIGELDAAAESYGRSIELNPAWGASYLNLGTVYRRQGQTHRALDCLKGVLEKEPGSVAAMNNLGSLYIDLGDIGEAIGCFTRALSSNPDLPMTRSNILLASHYSTVEAPALLFEAHREWGRLHGGTPGTARFEFGREKDPDRPIRIGYLSPDFHKHSVSFFMEPIFEHHRKEQVELYAYSDNLYEDDTTRRLMAHAVCLRRVAGMPDRQLARRIHADGIDILVDLCGHTAHHRLPVFAMKPAPVQVTYLGYPDTTGLEQMDYRITDAEADPPGTADDLHTERLARLPGGFLCYRPPPEAPPAAKKRALEESVVFGSFNYSGKISPETVSAWADILRELPEARLCLKAAVFADGAVRESFMEKFAALGVAAGRITFWGRVDSTGGHLDRYNEIDIALDTFPYNGTTTTCEALWMGTPVVTMAGNVHAARVGASILRQAGLADLIAKDRDEYVKTAVSLGRDGVRLRNLQESLREKIAASPLMDAKAFVSGLEAAYREMWREWCRAGEEKTMDSATPNDVDWVLEGERLFEQGEVDNAERAFVKALAIDPSNVTACNNLGVLHWHKGDPEMAVRYLEKALSISPEDETALLNLGEIRKKFGSTESHGCDKREDRPEERKLHIGGSTPHPEWEIFNIVAAEAVDHVGDARDLSRFPDEAFSAIYASHVLEHFDYLSGIEPVLREWHRVLKPGGKLYVSVPDLDKLAELLLMKEKMTIQDRFQIMRMMFGGHVDEHDFHQSGLNEDFLSGYLRTAGFVNLKVVEKFSLFEDTSDLEFKGHPVSLNIIAEKREAQDTAHR